MALLQIEDLTVRAGAATLIDSLSLSMSAGEILVLAGESGSGKSLTALSILRLLAPGLSASGAIRLEGRDLLTLSEPEMCKLRGAEIGMVFQEPMTALNPLMTIGEQIAETLRLHRRVSKAEARAAAAEVLGRVGLASAGVTPDRFPHQLSGGQRQRAAIAMAIVLAPKLILADEPTTALDVTTQAEIVDLLTGLARQDGAGLLFITHDLALAASMADRIAIMEKGRLVQEGETGPLFANLTHPYARALVAAARPQTFPPRALRAEAAPILEATNIVRDYRGQRPHPFAKPPLRRAVDQITLSLQPGEIVALVGQSGSGKSTLARTLLALEVPQSGEVRLTGEAFSSAAGTVLRKLRPRIQAVFQDPYGSLDPRWTVERIVTEPLELTAPSLSADQRQARAATMLAEVGLAPELGLRHPHQLSGGQRQRVAIARALIAEPRVIVLDEATSALDVSTRAQILRLIHDLAVRRNIAFLFVSHDLATVRSLADRVIVLQGGKVVEQGPTEAVFADPQHVHTRALIAATPDLDQALAARAQ